MVAHAEVNAIYNAARHGHVTMGCKIYVPWHPCSNCANAIVQAGIVEVILDGDFVEDPELMKRWEQEHNIAEIIFREGGVKVRKSTPQER
jgi:dCMP deaminase